MDKKSNISIVVLLVLFGTHLFAQESIRPGYIISTEKDTISGFLKYRESSLRYSSCLFKKNEPDPFKEYKANDLLGYGYKAGKLYVTCKVYDEKGDMSEVFMEVLVNGRLKLLKWQNQLYVQKDSAEVILLKNTYKEVTVNNNKYFKYNYEYISTLNILLADCSTASAQLSNLKLLEPHLIKFVAKANQTCYPESYIPPDKNSTAAAFMNIDMGVFLSYGVNSLNVVTPYENTDYQVIGKYDPSYKPRVGVQFDFYSKRLSEKFKFHIELNYFTNSFRLYKEVQFSPVRTRISEVNINVASLAIPVGVKYRFSGKKIYPYVEAAFLTIINLKKESSWTEQEVVNGGSPVTTQDNVEATTLNSKQFGVWAKAGLMYNLSTDMGLFLELQYDYSKRLLDLAYLFSHNNSLALRIGVSKTF